MIPRAAIVNTSTPYVCVVQYRSSRGEQLSRWGVAFDFDCQCLGVASGFVRGGT
jgi:hypothetical protein